MAAIASVSNLSYGARSVSFTAVAAGADTLAFSVIAAALAAAGVAASDNSVPGSAIYSFLTTSHTDAAGTLAALASNGAVCDAIASATGISVFVGGNNSLSISGASTVSVRIALAASVSA